MLVDESETLLDAARRLFREKHERTTFIQTDFLEPGWTANVAASGPFDAVVSVFALQRALAGKENVGRRSP